MNKELPLETFTFEYLDYNNEYRIRKTKSYYGPMGAANRIDDMKHIISINGEIHDNFSAHHLLCPICRTNRQEEKL